VEKIGWTDDEALEKGLENLLEAGLGLG